MASFLQGVKNLFFGKAKTEDEQEEEQQAAAGHRQSGHKRRHSSRSSKPTAVLQDAGHAGSGGVQGLGWYTASLQLDADGDAAHAFYQEQPSSSQLQQVKASRPPSRQQCRLKGVQQGHVVISGVS